MLSGGNSFRSLLVPSVIHIFSIAEETNTIIPLAGGISTLGRSGTQECIIPNSLYPAASPSPTKSSIPAPSPVASMPNELLESIFDACVRWLYARRLPENCLAWTQVCTRWRCVALGSVRLWQYIDLSHARFAREFLIRSTFAPIFIMAHAPDKRFTGSLHPHAGRICSIDVVFRSHDMLHLLTDLGSVLPNLSALSLALQPGSQNLRCDMRINNVRRLALNGIAIPWDTCSNLTQLSLRGLGETFAPTISQLRSILDNSPELESFRTENVSFTIPFLEESAVSSDCRAYANSSFSPKHPNSSTTCSPSYTYLPLRNCSSPVPRTTNFPNWDPFSPNSTNWPISRPESRLYDFAAGLFNFFATHRLHGPKTTPTYQPRSPSYPRGRPLRSMISATSSTCLD